MLNAFNFDDLKKLKKNVQAFIKLTKLFKHFLFYIMESIKLKYILKIYRILLASLLFLIILEELLVCINYFEKIYISLLFTIPSLLCIKCHQSVSVYIQICI